MAAHLGLDDERRRRVAGRRQLRLNCEREREEVRLQLAASVRGEGRTARTDRDARRDLDRRVLVALEHLELVVLVHRLLEDGRLRAGEDNDRVGCSGAQGQLDGHERARSRESRRTSNDEVGRIVGRLAHEVLVDLDRLQVERRRREGGTKVSSLSCARENGGRRTFAQPVAAAYSAGSS